MSRSRERVQAALEHRGHDIPIDFGATPVSGMHISVVADLRKHYGLDDRPVRLIEPYQMLGEIDDELASPIGSDTVGVFGSRTIFGFSNTEWREWRTPWGQDVLVPDGFRTRRENGSIVIFPEGDTNAPPSGRMPNEGYYFDSIIRQEPIVEESLDPEDNLEEFADISDEDLAYYRDSVNEAEKSERAIVMALPGGGLGDIALIPAPFLKFPRGIRDVEEWYISTVARQDYLHAVFDEQTKIALRNFKRIYTVVGNAPDVAFLCGTDFGTQSSTFCSIETFKSLYLPYYKRMNDWIHTHTKWRTFKHSCGAIADFIPSFIEAGFDIINPVQLSAAGMDVKELKADFGDSIVFWGGGVDTQKTLPFGTEADVRAEVDARLDVLSTGGGFVFNAIHNVQAKTPVKNIAAMIDAARIRRSD